MKAASGLREAAISEKEFFRRIALERLANFGSLIRNSDPNEKAL